MRHLLFVLPSVFVWKADAFVALGANLIPRHLTPPMATHYPSTTTNTCLDMKFFDTIEGMLFPAADLTPEVVDPHQEFLRQSLPVQNADSARQSLEFFLQEWAMHLERDTKSAGLSTNISLQPFRAVVPGNETRRQLKLMFRPPPRYLSYNEQKSMEKGVLPDRKGAKLDSKSPGGIAIVVSTVSPTELQLVAQRCGVDSDTVIKASSERAIIRRLSEALRIWKKVRDMKLS